MLPALLLALALAPLAWLMARRRRSRGGRRYPRILRQSSLCFGVPSVALLGVTGQLGAFVALPAAFAPAAAVIGVEGVSAGNRRYLLASVAIGVTVGIVIGVLLTFWRAWHGRSEGSLLGDASAVRPARGELGWAAVVAVTAGVTEEAYFRLLLPLLATQAFGNAVVAFAAATLLFGFAHRYQGWRGIAATTVAGAAMTGGYLATGSLVAMMAAHAAGDLGHLVLRPAVRGWVERRRASSSAANPSERSPR